MEERSKFKELKEKKQKEKRNKTLGNKNVIIAETRIA